MFFETCISISCLLWQERVVMGKFEFSGTGISGFIGKLYAMDDATLQREAERIARDPIAALAGHFELQVTSWSIFAALQRTM